MKNKIYQQIHRMCGGELVLVKEDNKISVLCKKCFTGWISKAEISKSIEWRNIKNDEAKKSK